MQFSSFVRSPAAPQGQQPSQIDTTKLQQSSSSASAPSAMQQTPQKAPERQQAGNTAQTAAVPSVDDLKRNIGPATWTLLHSVAAIYPRHPSDEDKREAQNLVSAIAHFYPCEYCREDFQDDVKEHPPNVNSREDFSIWMCERHNTVNEKLGKPLVDCRDIWLRWGKAASNADRTQHGDENEDEDCTFCADKFGKENARKMQSFMKEMGFGGVGSHGGRSSSKQPEQQ